MAERLIVNASPLIFLARVQGLEWLLLFDSAPVGVPRGVCDEIAAGADGTSILNTIERSENFQILEDVPMPPSVAVWDLGLGESQVLSHCVGQAGCGAVLDDRAARQCARSHFIPVVGTLGIILAAKERGEIPKARPVVTRLLKEGLYLSPSIVEDALALVGE